jgi:Uncharacterized protein conserved in bacteria
MFDVWNFIVTNVFRNPPVLIGVIAAIGLILQKKKIEDVFKGAILAAMGLYMLVEGTNFISSSITPINMVFRQIAGVEVPQGLDAASFMTAFGSECGMAMFIGLILHLCIARFTPIKTVFLTGHFLWWIPLTFVAAGVEGGLEGVTLIVFAAIFAALYWSFAPWILRKYVWAVTDDKTWMLGHPTGILSLIAGTVAKFVGNKKKSTEDLNIPKRLSFLKETSVVGFFVTLLIYIVLDFGFGGAIAEYVGQDIFTYGITMGLRFGVGLLVLLQGVRMLINQIVPAFEGISTKLIKDAIPAYDCPLMFPYRPNAAIIGFIVAMTVSVPLMLVFNSTGFFGVMLVPLVITCFFECGTAAIIAEGQGGLRGAIIGTAVAAVAMVFLVGFSSAFFANTIQNRMLTVSGNDYSLYGPLVGMIAKLLHSIIGG